MLFLHEDCGGNCDIDMSSFISIVGKPFLGEKGMLSARNISITTSEKKVLEGKEVKFICDVCDETVTEDEIYALCGYCKKSFSLSELLRNDECGELLCEPCDEKFFETRTALPVLQIVKQIALD